MAFASGGSDHQAAPQFPRSLESYQDGHLKSIIGILGHRIREEPFNLVATLIFFCAIIHTFLSSKFLAIAHRWNTAHAQLKKQGKVDRDSVHIGAGVFHFLGEVEAIFGIWGDRSGDRHRPFSQLAYGYLLSGPESQLYGTHVCGHYHVTGRHPTDSENWPN